MAKRHTDYNQSRLTIATTACVTGTGIRPSLTSLAHPHPQRIPPTRAAGMVAQLQERNMNRSSKKKAPAAPPPAQSGHTAKTVLKNGKPVIKLTRDPSAKSKQPVGPPPSGRHCSKCGVYKEEGDYSGKQWKLGKARKCKACVVPG